MLGTSIYALTYFRIQQSPYKSDLEAIAPSKTMR